MGTVDHRDVLLIAGDDPYEFKGIEDLMHPDVRPRRRGRLPPLSSGQLRGGAWPGRETRTRVRARSKTP